MSVPTMRSITNTNPIKECLDNIPVGIIKRKDSRNFSLKIELCSFTISDSSKIKKISIWHCFTKKLAMLGTDILVLEGEGIQPTEALDHLGTTRCLGTEKKNELVYFLDSKNKAILNVINILLKIHELSPTWLSKTSLCEITPKFEAFINIPKVRSLKKMQFEAQYLFKSCVPETTFANFLSMLFSSTLQFEKCPLSKLQCLATHEIKSLKEQMSSPRVGMSSELTDQCTFMHENEERLVNHIKRVARKRLIWGYNKDDIPDEPPVYKGTVAHMFRNVFSVEVVGVMAAYDL